MELHRRLPGYRPTRLVEAHTAVPELGLARLWVKDESERMGLPAFKILGASWATYRALDERLLSETGASLAAGSDVETMRERLAPLRPLTLACATDGNHGRAVARMAKLLGFGARIYVPDGMAPARVEAIAGEGAEIVVVAGTYDEAIARSAAEARESTLVISDTAWPGYEAIPRWVIEGYSTIFWEVEDELERLGERGPDVVALQAGVGAFAAAGVRHFRRPDVSPAPMLVGVEPAWAACVMASMEAGDLVEVPGPHDSIMAGLNCGTPSPIAWPLLASGIDRFVAIDEARVAPAMRALAAAGVESGESGAAGLAGLMTLAERFGLDLRGRRAFVISTEGATDPAAYAAIVG
jgi:diaminopropionate ammonia-lyase